MNERREDVEVLWMWPDGYADHDVQRVRRTNPYTMAVEAVSLTLEESDFEFTYVTQFKAVVPFCEGRALVTIDMKMEDHP